MGVSYKDTADGKIQITDFPGGVKEILLIEPSQAFLDKQAALPKQKLPKEILAERKAEYLALTTDAERIEYLAKLQGLI